VRINCRVDCTTRHVVYLVTCTKCKKQYVGQTTRSLAEAFAEHLNIINNRITNQPTGRHFTLPGKEQPQGEYLTLPDKKQSGGAFDPSR
jgi:hypothetical protein